MKIFTLWKYLPNLTVSSKICFQFKYFTVASKAMQFLFWKRVFFVLYAELYEISENIYLSSTKLNNLVRIDRKQGLV